MIAVVLILCGVFYVNNGQGCAKSPDTHVLVKGAISACAGMFSNGMFDNSTTSLCASGYKVCSNQTEMASMGLTHTVCEFGSSNDANMLYLSQVGGLGWNCDVLNVPNVASVFGCGGGTYIHAATHCGVLADVGSTGEEIGYPADMGATDDNDNLHSVFNNGETKTGVLCCKAGRST
eukprot:539681_1